MMLAVSGPDETRRRAGGRDGVVPEGVAGIGWQLCGWCGGKVR